MTPLNPGQVNAARTQPRAPDTQSLDATSLLCAEFPKTFLLTSLQRNYIENAARQNTKMINSVQLESHPHLLKDKKWGAWGGVSVG